MENFLIIACLNFASSSFAQDCVKNRRGQTVCSMVRLPLQSTPTRAPLLLPTRTQPVRRGMCGLLTSETSPNEMVHR